jgi:hypothetical protein
MSNDEFRMTNDGKDLRQRKVRHWPGMPSRQTQMFESLFPFLLPVLAIVIAFLLLLRSCLHS